MKCPRCQQDNPSHAKFCLECGIPVNGAAPTATSYVDLKDEVESLKRSLGEALEQQTATSEILRVISRSQTDVQPVFDTIVRSAVRLCDGLFSALYQFDSDLIHHVAHHNYTPEALEEVRRRFPARPTRGLGTGRAILERAVIHIPDVELDQELQTGQALASAIGFRSGLFVPMLREDAPIGVIVVARAEPGPFSDNEIALLKTFADQAVIAIENVRLFNETKEALEQQTATSEILGVIASSPTDVQPVFDAIARSASRLLGGAWTVLTQVEDGALQLVAHQLQPWSADVVQEFVRTFPRPLDHPSPPAIAVRTGEVFSSTDAQSDPKIAPALRANAAMAGYRRLIIVPMLRDGRGIGAIHAARAEAGSFSDAEIALLKTFAAQAIIAIENVRLFKELQARNAELTETLARQTATGEVLRAISHAQTDAQPVFDIIAASARRLCGAGYGQVDIYDGEWLHLAALDNVNPQGVEALRRRSPVRVDRGSVMGRAIQTRTVVEIPDVREDPAYAFKSELVTMGFQSLLAVPMLRQDQPIGAIAVGRAERGVFADKQIELLKIFADQAVIAIENVRLFKELEARTAELTRSVRQLTALGEVGQAVSSTLDLETVLTTIASRASQLAGTRTCTVYEYDEQAEEFHLRATHNVDERVLALNRARHIRKGEGSAGRVAETRAPVQIEDIAQEGAYHGWLREVLLQVGVRSILAVPLLREDRLIGALIVTRNTPGRFDDEIIALLQTFATQSHLAIHNARLFRELADKSRQLEVASQHKSEFLANMSHELRTPLNAIIGFSEVLAEGMFGAINEKQTEYLRDILESGQHLLSLINDILDLSKIEAGRMELEPTDFHLPDTIENALILVRERANRRGITVGRSVDERLGMIRADERKVKQVLLNLLSNALKFTPEGGRIDVGAVLADDVAEISVTDTGVGIAAEDQEAIFEEFRQVGTAAKKVEGTGLGLALSRRFIELHGGRIWVKSQVGSGSTFTFTVPLREARAGDDQ